jgi:hypothetical protein
MPSRSVSDRPSRSTDHVATHIISKVAIRMKKWLLYVCPLWKSPRHDVVAEGDKACGARMAIMDLRYLNNAIASSASTPPVIEFGANGALAETSALDSMI